MILHRTLRITVASLAAALTLAGCPKSPQDEITAAENALRVARDAGARDCAPAQFKSAEDMMALTYKLNDEEEYKKAKDSAVTTKELAEVAKVETDQGVAAGKCKPGLGSGATAPTDGAALGGAKLSEAEVAAEVAQTKTGEGALGEGSLVPGLKPVHFGYDEAVLSPDEMKIVSENAAWLSDRPTAKVQIEGHTDERGTNEYNLALGERRAKAVLEALVRLGVDAARLKTISYGEEMPVAQGHDDAAWKQNRRAEFVVQ
jgi:peptidoglycan-associated lipoprotein